MPLSHGRPLPPGPDSVAKKVVSEFKLQTPCPVHVFCERFQELGAVGETTGLPVISSADPTIVKEQVVVLPRRLAVKEQVGAAFAAAGSGAVIIL